MGMENVLKGKYSDLIFLKLNELELGEKILNAPKCSVGHRRKMVDLEEVTWDSGWWGGSNMRCGNSETKDTSEWIPQRT